MTEGEIQRRIQLACSRGDARLWRNQVGMSWTGKSHQAVRRETVVLEPGDVVIRGARMVKVGMGKGSPDLIGYRVVEVTPAMLGSRIAVFAGVEVKSAKGRVSPEQQNFLDRLGAAGGLAGVARSPEDAHAILNRKPGVGSLGAA
jgi:hypothetical protein